MPQQAQSTIAFHEFFARANELGHDLPQVAATLLQAIRTEAAAGKVIGIQWVERSVSLSGAEQREKWAAEVRLQELVEQFEGRSNYDFVAGRLTLVGQTAGSPPVDPEARAQLQTEMARLQQQIESYFDGWRKDAPDPILRTVPISIWEEFDRVEHDGTCEWPEYEDPTAWGTAHLIEGTVTEHDPWRGKITKYTGLRIDSALAALILANPYAFQISADQQPPKYTDEEREYWIRARGRSPGGKLPDGTNRNGADGAHAEFQLDPRCDGTKQPQFRDECRQIWGEIKGRPKGVKKAVTST